MTRSTTTRTIAIATLASGAGLVVLLAMAGGSKPPAPAKPAPAARPRPVVIARPVAAPIATPAPKPAPVETGYVVRRVLDVPEPLRHGDYYWNTAGVPDGPIVITVDLAAQVLSIFRAGYEIGTAAVIYGADDKPTPLGVFAITQKDAHHVSNLYDAPMPYMMRLTNDGVSIHGSKLMEGKYATHGCVGVPTPFAKLIFDQVKLGDKVIVTNGETLRRGGRITAA